jgi:lipopolysaccharide transport system permease protein
VQYRDVKYVLGFLTQIWLFLTPVVYPTSIVPAGWRSIYALNPMVGVVEGFRWSVAGGTAPGPSLLIASTVAAAVLLLTGLRYFQSVEENFADVI